MTLPTTSHPTAAQLRTLAQTFVSLDAVPLSSLVANGLQPSAPVDLPPAIQRLVTKQAAALRATDSYLPAKSLQEVMPYLVRSLGGLQTGEGSSVPITCMNGPYGIGKTRLVESMAASFQSQRNDVFLLTINGSNYQHAMARTKLWTPLELIAHRFQCTSSTGGLLHPQTFALLNQPHPSQPGLKKGDLIDELSSTDLKQIEQSFRLNDGVYVEPLPDPLDPAFSLEKWKMPMTGLAFPEPTVEYAAVLHPEMKIIFHCEEFGTLSPREQDKAMRLVAFMGPSSGSTGGFDLGFVGSHLRDLPLTPHRVCSLNYNLMDARQEPPAGYMQDRLAVQQIPPMTVDTAKASLLASILKGWQDPSGKTALADVEAIAKKPKAGAAYAPITALAQMPHDVSLELVQATVDLTAEVKGLLCQPATSNGEDYTALSMHFGAKAAERVEAIKQGYAISPREVVTVFSEMSRIIQNQDLLAFAKIKSGDMLARTSAAVLLGTQAETSLREGKGLAHVYYRDQKLASGATRVASYEKLADRYQAHLLPNPAVPATAAPSPSPVATQPVSPQPPPISPQMQKLVSLAQQVIQDKKMSNWQVFPSAKFDEENACEIDGVQVVVVPQSPSAGMSAPNPNSRVLVPVSDLGAQNQGAGFLQRLAQNDASMATLNAHFMKVALRDQAPSGQPEPQNLTVPYLGRNGEIEERILCYADVKSMGLTPATLVDQMKEEATRHRLHKARLPTAVAATITRETPLVILSNPTQGGR